MVDEFVTTNAMWVQNQPLTTSEVDHKFGRKPVMIPNGLFKMNTTLDFAAVAPDGNVNMHFSVRTNNFGLLSDKDYVVKRQPEKPEFRIVVLGDSFTGTTTATYQWVDTL